MASSFPISLPPFLEEVDSEVRIVGTRITIGNLLYLYNTFGYSAEMLTLEYPSVPLATVYKLLAFYLENLGTIDSFIAAEDCALASIRAAWPDHISLDALRHRTVSEIRKV